MTTKITEEIPIVDAEIYMNKQQGWEEECKKTALSFHKFGIVKFRDPRVNEQDNNEYIDMVEKYFAEVSEKFYNGEELKDVRADLCYQAGATPEGMERARNHKELVDSLTEDNKPMSIQPPVVDAKWRFFWKIGERPEEVKDDIPQVYPENFPDWET